MPKKPTSAYEEKLRSERESLLQELSKGKNAEDFGSDVDSLDEEADEAEEFGNRLALNQVLKDRIAEVDRALLKIKAGTYGVCERCGKTVSPEVLEAAPSSRFCKICKEGA